MGELQYTVYYTTDKTTFKVVNLLNKQHSLCPLLWG